MLQYIVPDMSSIADNNGHYVSVWILFVSNFNVIDVI